MPKLIREVLPAVLGHFNPTAGYVAKKLLAKAKKEEITLPVPKVNILDIPTSIVDIPSTTTPSVSKKDMSFRQEWIEKNKDLAKALGVGSRRRKRPRLTGREIQELLILKQVVGTRSPLLTIAGMRMLSRGG